MALQPTWLAGAGRWPGRAADEAKEIRRTFTEVQFVESHILQINDGDPSCLDVNRSYVDISLGHC